MSRQNQAIANLEFVLHAIGPQGRRNPFMVFPLRVVAQWRASHATHHSSSAADQRVQMWMDESRALYGPGTSSSTTTISTSATSYPSKHSISVADRSPTLSDHLPPSPASLSRTGSSARLSLPGIASLTSGSNSPILGVSGISRARSSSSASSTGGYAVPALPTGSGLGAMLPVPVASGSPGWLFGSGGGGSGGPVTPSGASGGGVGGYF